MLDGELDLQSTFSGPAVARGIPQDVERSHRFGATNDELRRRYYYSMNGYQVIVCSEDEARRFHGEEHYDWSKGTRDAVAWLNTSFERMFDPYVEEYPVALFDDVDDVPANEAGIALAREGRWADAVVEFGKAATSMQGDSEDAREARAHLLHNLAAAHMTAGDLEKAREVAAAALALLQEGKTSDLLGEIEKRRYDTERM